MARFWISRSRFEKALVVLFLLTMPFAHARVRADGIGYYAYLRSLLIDHNLNFSGDWNRGPNRMFYLCKACPSSFKLYWNNPAYELLFVSLNGRYYFNPITKTGHLPNFYTVGPALLWAPFVVPAHLAVLAADRLGARIPPDGHSWPYLVALAAGTGVYGFLAIYFSFRFARGFVEERLAFWAALGIWFASSLPVYMYLDPSWSHAHSAFCASLFLWYWHRTRASRTPKQWIALGLITGLMLEVYFANALFLLAPGLEAMAAYAGAWQARRSGLHALWGTVKLHLLFAASALVAFLPMLIAREIVYGSPFAAGMYANVSWNWRSPVFGKLLFSSDHGLFVWTPILLVASLGLFALGRLDRAMARTCIMIVVGFYFLISVYPWWYGTPSFGNRFFVSLTPVFVLGLAAAFSWVARFWSDSRHAARRLAPLTLLLIFWNLGLMYQWSTHLLPTPGVIQWSEVLYNQFHVVPQQVLARVSAQCRSDLRLLAAGGKEVPAPVPRGLSATVRGESPSPARP